MASALSLADVCDINPRLGRDHGFPDDHYVSFVPMAAVDEVSGSIREKQKRLFGAVKKGFTTFRDGDVLFAKITPCMENGKCAVARDLIGGIGFGSTEFHVLRPKDMVLAEWVYYFLRRDVFRQEAKRNFTGTAGQQRVPTSFLEKSRIPVPSLIEQRRIVDILARAEGIVRLRREAEVKAKAIIPALFIDMFGDPTTNPKNWPIRKVKDFVARFEGGKNLMAGSNSLRGFRILKISAVTSGRYLESESKAAPNDYKPPTEHIVREGDLLFSRANTEALVGATAIVPSTDGRTVLPDKLWRVVWSEPVDSAYMHALFQSPSVRGALGRLSSGTSASMRNISQGKLFELALPIAPYDRQKEFGGKAWLVQSVMGQQSNALGKAEATFAALLSRTFSAEPA